jgi:hypothetical protein
MISFDIQYTSMINITKNISAMVMVMVIIGVINIF